MTVTVPRLIAGWGIGNGVLAAILVGYGENPFAIALYAAAVALLELIALSAWLSLRRRPENAYRSPAALRSDAALVTALGMAFAGAGFVYHWWMALPAAYSVLWLAVHALGGVFDRRVVDVPADAEALEPTDAPLVPNAVVGAATAATAATATVVARRWWRRRR